MELEGKMIGQIRVDELVGEGGMGAVYRGVDLRLERTVAVKTLRDRYRDDPVGRARFLREAQILSRLDHPGICKVYGLLRHEESDLLVLEWLEGRTLDKAAADVGTERRMEICVAMADALAVAHSQQIVHRDLKPENVVVTADGQVTILDFGIARSAEGLDSLAVEAAEEDSFYFTDADLDSTWAGGQPRSSEAARAAAALTRDGSTVGTVAYMSPEQVGGLPLGVASDMYSFGVLMQEIFTGRRAYDDVGHVQLMSLVVVGQTRPLGDDLDPELAQLIRSLQSLDEAARPSAAAVRDALLRILRAPEERQRRSIRRAVAGLLAAVILLALAAIVQQRLEAQRSVEQAREMTRMAAEAEWLMRAEHLAPPHDLRPARREVRRRMDELERRRQALDASGRAVGDLALGRAALALDRVDESVRYLERAWSAGLRDPQAAASYGLALAEQLRRQLVRAERQRADADRLRLRAEAEETRALARSLLASAGAAETVGPATARLARAQLAFLDERWGEAVAEAAEASADEVWFYEGDLLAARTYRQRILRRVHGDGDEVGAGDDLRRALAHLERAASVGRSDPGVYLERCALAYDLLALQLAWSGMDLESDHRAGLEACRAALEIDPENARGHLMEALLLARAAELADAAARDGLLESSVAAARRAVELDPGDAETWRALAMGSMVRADYEVARGGDPETALQAAIDACVRGTEVAPRDVQLLNLLGNAEGIRAEMAWARGDSTLQAVERAVRAYERAIAVGEAMQHLVPTYPRTNLAIQMEVGVRWLVSRGEDPRDLAEKGLEHARLALAENDKNGYAWTAVAGLAGHLSRWHLERGELGEASDRAGEALEAAGQAARWRDDTYSLEVSIQARVEAARAASRRDDPGGARGHLDQALELSARLAELDPSFIPGWIQRSRALAERARVSTSAGEMRRRAQEALEAAEKALDIDPDFVPAREAARSARRLAEEPSAGTRLAG